MTTAPSSVPTEEVRVLIAGLDSVRDYDRLRYVLNAIEEQPASARAALLAELDDRILRITQADAEARAASALATAKLFASATLPASTAPSTITRPRKTDATHDETTPSSPASSGSSTAPSWSRPKFSFLEGRPKKSASAIRQAIGEASVDTMDPKDAAKAMREIHLDIMTVEEPAERLELYNVLSERSKELGAIGEAKAHAAREALQSAAPSAATSAQHP